MMRGSTLKLPEVEGLTGVLELAPPDTYRDGDAWVQMPAQPSANHECNFVTKTWVDPRGLSDFRALKRRDIEVEREARINAPISYDGAMLDADKQAQNNISAKLQ